MKPIAYEIFNNKEHVVYLTTNKQLSNNVISKVNDMGDDIFNLIETTISNWIWLCVNENSVEEE